MRHAADAWARRDAPNVVLAHYADLSADLPGEMRRMAGRLGVAVPAGRWPALLSAATFPRMRAHASQLAQGPPGILIDDAAFFRSGTSGAAVARYPRRNWPPTTRRQRSWHRQPH
jgi:aryl sulfotransferase